MKAWLKNLPSFHHRILARFLRKHGWVVFYLEPEFRKCSNPDCWINAYEAGEKAHKRGKK